MISNIRSLRQGVYAKYLGGGRFEVMPIHASRNDSNANGVYVKEGCASHEIGIDEYLLSFLD